ncbi:tetratricopeptide repeat protein [Bacillus sp. S35]|uniref:tetratricopeptide repeat protein n=1 Tax=Priestia aryabhattai TaxID=412384 RepID=UPI00190C0820|nr:tetratricopeptide repeat protein [Priestia aryabhattai]MBK0009705.1 tetratricopeptide repeat protein [Bacillus sp. S35]MCM3644488.1 tetratricopeptide repeat protein [Priestia aryabhattai]
MISHEIEMKDKIETIVRDFVRELHSTVHTEVDFFYSTNERIEGPAEMVELIQQSSFFNVSSQTEEIKIIQNLNKQIQDKNLTIDNEISENENFKLDNSLTYINYLFLSDSTEKILFLFTFQGFENNVTKIYNRGSSYSFLRFLLDKVFEELRSKKISSILDGEVYENKTDILPIILREFTEELVKKICETDGNNLYNELYYISSLNYEGSSISAKLMVLNEKNMDRFVDFFIKLDKKISYKEHRKIRKILEISDDNMYLIGDDKYVYGIGKARNFGEIKQLKKENKILVINFIGKFEFSINLIDISREIIRKSDEHFEDIRWSWNEINCVQITYGKPSLQEKQFSSEILSESLKKIFHGYFESKKYNSNDITDKISKLIDIVEYATRQKHGTMLVIAEPKLAAKEIERLENQSIKIIKTEFMEKGAKYKANNLIERITNIDGALYLDIEGYCHAIGVILDGIAEKGQGDTARGARYNSAIKYYNVDNIKENCVIVIISEDGMVDIIPESKKETQTANRLYNEIKSLYRDKDFEKALEKCEQLLRGVDPGFKRRAYLLKAFLLLKLEGASETQIELCTEAIKLNDKHSVAFWLRGDIYRKLEEHDKAIDDYTEAIKLDPNNKGLYSNRGLQYKNKKEYDKAIDDFTKAIELDEKYAYAYYNRAVTYSENKKYDKAIDDYCQAIKLDSNFQKFYMDLDILFNKLIELHPEKAKEYELKIEEVGKLINK